MEVNRASPHSLSSGKSSLPLVNQPLVYALNKAIQHMVKCFSLNTLYKNMMKQGESYLYRKVQNTSIFVNDIIVAHVLCFPVLPLYSLSKQRHC